jgi:hypothetical protein
MSLFRGGIEQGSAGLVPLWIMSPPFDYAQAEKNGGVEGWRSGIGHSVSIIIFSSLLTYVH